MAGGGNERLASLNEELQNLMVLEERMWSQRAKSDDMEIKILNTFTVELLRGTKEITFLA